jgi:hypothetical protein
MSILRQSIGCVLGAVCLAGCSFSSPPVQPEEPLTPVVAFMIQHGDGENTVLDDPEFGQGVHISIQEHFTSADGGQCKRAALTRGHEAEMVVVCEEKTENGTHWRMAPRIWGQGLTRP